MKKFTLSLLGMMALCVGAYAQDDVTSTYIKNADFSSVENWTINKSSQYSDVGNGLIGTLNLRNKEGQISTTDATHTAEMHCLGMEARWSPNFASYKQDITLPAGNYKVTYDVQNRVASKGARSYESMFSFGGVTDAAVEWGNGITDWTAHSILLSLEEEKTVTLSFGYKMIDNLGDTETPCLYVSNLKLYKLASADKEALTSVLTKANALLEETSKNGIAELQAAVTTAQTVFDNADASQGEVDAAVADLKTAINSFADANAWLADGEYFIKNVEANAWLVGANSWGTKASLNEDYGFPVTISRVIGTENLYSISTAPTYAGKFLGSNGFVDSGKADWTLGKVEGKDGVFTLSAGGKFLNGSADATALEMVDVADKYGVFQLISVADYKAAMAEATAKKPVSVSNLIVDPGFSRNADASKWVYTAGKVMKGGGNDVNNNSESYKAPVAFSQTLAGMPAGEYKVKAQAFVRNEVDNADESVRAQLFIGTDTVDVPYITSGGLTENTFNTGKQIGNLWVPNSQTHAANYFDAGKYEVEATTELTEDGDLVIGAVCTSGDLWFVYDNFRVEYLGAKRHVPATGWTTSNVAAGDFYLYNVGTKKFLNGGNAWGTQASITPEGQLMTFAELEDGTYTIDSHIANNATNHFVGDNGYVDSPTASWTFEPVEGVAGAYIMKTGDKYLVANGENTICDMATEAPADNFGYWQLVTVADMIEDAKALATEDNPVDLTSLIKGANFGRNNQYNSSWSGNPKNGGDNTNNNGEVWNAAVNVAQTVNVPNGLYTVKMQGYYRPGGNANVSTEQRASWFANEKTALLPLVASQGKAAAEGGFTTANTNSGETVFVPNSQGDASAVFGAGYYENEIAKVMVVDGTLKLGITKTETIADDWTIFDNFRILYYGESEDLSTFEESLAKVVAKATEVDPQTLTDAAFAALKTVVNENNKTYTTSEEYLVAINNINEAYAESKKVATAYAAAVKVNESIAAIVAATDTYTDNGGKAAFDEAFAAIDFQDDATVEDINADITATRNAFGTFIAGITPVADIDITDVYMVNANIRGGINGWIASNNGNGYNDRTSQGDNVEFWNEKALDIHQAIGTLPAAQYRVDAIMMCRENSQEVLYFNEIETAITGVPSGVANNNAQAGAWFDEGNGLTSVEVTLTEPADVTIGFKVKDAAGTDAWTVWRSIKLILASAGELTGINTVDSETLNGNNAAERGAIYNLAGQKVGKNYKGIVIKNGKKTIQ